MEYKGKLYGRLGHKQYFDTSHTTDDWDNMVIRIAELEKENQVLCQPHVMVSLPLQKSKLWEMAKLIVEKQKAVIELKTNKVDWSSLEVEWFDWLEEELTGNVP